MKLYAVSDEYINYYDVSYIKNVVDFKLLEERCLEYMNSKKSSNVVKI